LAILHIQPKNVTLCISQAILHDIIIIIIIIVIVISGSAAQRGLWPSRPRGFWITLNDAPQSVGILLD
jgi:hypothetical protein